MAKPKFIIRGKRNTKKLETGILKENSDKKKTEKLRKELEQIRREMGK
jgi:hypothetical protein